MGATRCRRGRTAAPPLVPHEVPVDRRTKAHRIAAYASQLDLLTHEGRRLDDPDVLPPTERCWLPT